MDDADDFLAQQRAKLAALSGAAAQAEQSAGLAVNLQQRMQDLQRMADDALKPAGPANDPSKMTSAELAKAGLTAPQRSMASNGPPLVLCQACWDCPCACAGANARPMRFANVGSSSGSRHTKGTARPSGSGFRPGQPSSHPTPHWMPPTSPTCSTALEVGMEGGAAARRRQPSSASGRRGAGAGAGGVASRAQQFGHGSKTRKPGSQDAERRSTTAGSAGGNRSVPAPVPALCLQCMDTVCRCAGKAVALCTVCFDVPCSC